MFKFHLLKKNVYLFYMLLFSEEYDEPSSRVENSFDSEEEKRVEVSFNTN